VGGRVLKGGVLAVVVVEHAVDPVDRQVGGGVERVRRTDGHGYAQSPGRERPPDLVEQKCVVVEVLGPRVLPVEVGAVKPVLLQEGRQAAGELDPQFGRLGHGGQVPALLVVGDADEDARAELALDLAEEVEPVGGQRVLAHLAIARHREREVDKVGEVPGLGRVGSGNLVAGQVADHLEAGERTRCRLLGNSGGGCGLRVEVEP